VAEVIVSEEAKRVIHAELGDAWAMVDGTTERVKALTRAIRVTLKDDVPEQHPSLTLCLLASDVMDDLWSTVDGILSGMRDQLGIRDADHQQKA
jgi:hypothetical protein